jgi:hypothetical protein
MVGTLLLGGRTRAELSAPSTKSRTLAATSAPPLIRVVRLPQPVERPAQRPVAEATSLTSAAS